MWNNQPNKFSDLSRYAHYLMGFAIIALMAVGFALGYEWLPKGPVSLWAISLHKLIGFIVLWLAILWLMNYLRQDSPAYPSGFPWLLKLAARSAKIILLFCAIVMPLSGWLMTVSSGKTMIPALGFNLPAPFVLHAAWGEVLWQVHQITAYILLATVTAHVCGALYHWLIRKDDIVQRMFPFIKRRRS